MSARRELVLLWLRRTWRSYLGTSVTIAVCFGIAFFGVLPGALSTSVRLHRRDLAVLGSLGLTRRQTMAAILTQGSVVVGCGLVAGVPIGFVLAIVVVGAAVAAAAAIRPAREARRLELATVLRDA